MRSRRRADIGDTLAAMDPAVAERLRAANRKQTMAVRFTASDLAATVAGRLPSNVKVLGVAAQTKRARTSEPKLVTLPPSTYAAAQGVCTVILPLPPKVLKANTEGHCHWRKKVEPRRLAKEAATYTALMALKGHRPMWSRASLLIRAYLTTRAHADKDNIVAWCKASIDGVAAAGLIADDSGLDSPVVEIGADRTCPRIELTFRRIE